MENTQGAVTCAVVSEIWNKNRVLEVGCGAGKHSVLIAETLLNKDGGILVSCDISGAMV